MRVRTFLEGERASAWILVCGELTGYHFPSSLFFFFLHALLD